MTQHLFLRRPGQHSRNTPSELRVVGGRRGLDADALVKRAG
jgi:hypothetical protein